MNITMRSLTSPRASSRTKRRQNPPQLSREARKLISRIRRQPADEDALRRLRDLYAERADHASLANLLEGWAQRTAHPTTAADLYHSAADAVLAADGPRARAAYLLERSLQRNPEHAERLDRLTGLLAQLGEFEALKHALQRLLLRLQKESEKESDTDSRWIAAVEFRLGRLYQSHFGEDDKALQHYRLALEHNPYYLPAIQGAQYLYRQRGNQRAVALLWELEIQATSEPQVQMELLLSLATHQDRRLGDLNGAIASLRRALRLSPNQTLTKVRLARLLLSRFHERGDNLDKARAAAVYLQLANQARGKRAVHYAQQCLELDPNSRAAQERLKSAQMEAEDPPDKVALAAVTPLLQSFAQTCLRARSLTTSPAEPAPQTSGPAPVAPADATVCDDSSSAPQAMDERSADAAAGTLKLAATSTREHHVPNGQATLRSPLPTDVDDWLHRDELSPLARDTGPLEPIEADQDAPPPSGHICRISDPLPPSAAHQPLEVNLGASTGSHLYVTLDGSLRTGGIFAVTYRLLRLNTPVALTVTFPGGYETCALGRVRFLRDTWDCDEDQEPGMAIEFEALTQRGLELMEQFASQRAPILYDN